MVNQKLLRLSAGLLIAGVLLSFIIGQFHPGREDANNHPAVFAEYASSAPWTAVHLGQFISLAVVIAGLFCLIFALDIHPGGVRLANRLAAASAVISLALYAVLQAVDGIALKRAVDAWVSAPEAEKAARFASAEVVRWLEEAVRSYHDVMLGLTFLLVALVVVWKAGVPRPVGYLMGVTGLLYFVQAWVLGMDGFGAAHGLASLSAYALILIWVIWLAVSAWRAPTGRPAGESPVLPGS